MGERGKIGIWMVKLKRDIRASKRTGKIKRTSLKTQLVGSSALEHDAVVLTSSRGVSHLEILDRWIRSDRLDAITTKGLDRGRHYCLSVSSNYLYSSHSYDMPPCVTGFFLFFFFPEYRYLLGDGLGHHDMTINKNDSLPQNKKWFSRE